MMITTNKLISEEFAKGNLEFAARYLAEDITWNILRERPIIGKEQVLEVSKMLQLQSYPLITIKKIIGRAITLLWKVPAKQQLKKVSLTIKAIVTFSNLRAGNCRK